MISRTSASLLNFWGEGKKGELQVELITNGQLFNQSCLCNAAPINTQKEEMQRASGLKSVEELGRWYTWRAWRLRVLSHIICPIHLSIWLLFVSFKTLPVVSKLYFPGFCEPLQYSIEHEGMVETYNLQTSQTEIAGNLEIYYL